MNALVHSWTLSDPSDLINGFGGNRYGWFDDNNFSTLAFDNNRLDTATVDANATVPEPARLSLLSLGLLGLGARLRWRKR